MRTKLFTAAAFGFISCFLFLVGCVKDQFTSRYTYWEPVYKTRAEVRANIKSNPAREIERPCKIYIRGNYIFLNEIDRGIHIIDNSNPAFPVKIAFIDIPGNLDMAVKGDLLYADFYTDLVAIDIANPRQVVVKKITDNIFPERYWGNGFSPNPHRIIVDWVKKDTVVKSRYGSGGIFGGFKNADVLMLQSGNSNSMAGGAGASPYGTGGSMARFTIVNNFLYAVSSSSLNVISIANTSDPVLSAKVEIGWDIETLYPFGNRLFIGSTSGMFIYNIDNPTQPVQMGSFSHARSCDPVIADNNYAFVTLRSGTLCQGFSNQLDVLDISNLNRPKLIKTYPLTHPHGLAKDGNTLIICDGAAGLKFYHATDISNLILQKTISGMEPYDVIAANGWALVSAKDGLYQYQFTDGGNVTELSKLKINN